MRKDPYQINVGDTFWRGTYHNSGLQEVPKKMTIKGIFLEAYTSGFKPLFIVEESVGGKVINRNAERYLGDIMDTWDTEEEAIEGIKNKEHPSLMDRIYKEGEE